MKTIFVFGSNLAGRHGRGAALYALRNHGAVYGVGTGPTGDAYAIPTKDNFIRTLSLQDIEQHIRNFLVYAREHPELLFQVTRVGCGLAGYTNEQIAPMFKNAPSNCLFDPEWLALL